MRTLTAQDLAAHDHALCVRLHRYSENSGICSFFRTISRLGDGVIWYATIVVLPFVFGADGLRVACVLSAASLLGIGIYKRIKGHFRRLRPCHRHPDINAAAITLDEFSFPSGHTLHAVSFTVILLVTLPALGWVFVPLAVLTGMSRVILGLHFPSDVLIGGLVGGIVAVGALQLGWLSGVLPLPMG